MENQPKIVVSLDIGTSKIAVAAAIKEDSGKIRILALSKVPSLGVSRGEVTNIIKATESIQSAIKDVSEKAQIEITEVYVGVAGQYIRTLFHRGQITRDNSNDIITQADIDRLEQEVRKLSVQAGEQIIDVLIQDYIVDEEKEIKDPIGRIGVCLAANCHVIVGKDSAINNIRRCNNEIGLKIGQFFLEPVASAVAVLSEEEKEGGVVLVDIGGGTTDVAIFYDGRIHHSAVIPFGGWIITEDIRKGCSILFNDAEELKINYGSAISLTEKETEIIAIPGIKGRQPKEISFKNLALIIESRMKEIIELVHHEIKTSGFERKLSNGIVLTGGGALLKNLPQLFEYVTGIETIIGYPGEHLVADTIKEIKNPMYATSVGLVIKGYEWEEMKSRIGIDEVNKKSRGFLGWLTDALFTKDI